MIDDFLEKTGWGKAPRTAIGEDCSSRQYFRLKKDNKTAVLMDSSQDDSLIDFIRIDTYLRSLGLNTPEIYETDNKNGYLILEDFGDISFKQALKNGTSAKETYALATDVLSFIEKHISPHDITLPYYYDSPVHKGHRRIIDWYLPARRETANPKGLAEEYLAIWAEIEQSLPPCPQGFLHIDYHVENLMWLPQNAGLKQVGLLDFQGAMYGPAPYDLANLLEDVRIDVPEELRQAMLNRFCAAMPPEEQELFKLWTRILATQFHCRIAGQFIKLAVQDKKERYLQYLPRVTNHLKNGLKHPVLKPLRTWFHKQSLDFDEAPVIIAGQTRSLIRDDAF